MDAEALMSYVLSAASSEAPQFDLTPAIASLPPTLCFSFFIQCEPPNARLYTFDGAVVRTSDTEAVRVGVWVYELG